MPALNFVITNAGKAAIANVGTLGPVVLQKVGIGSSVYAATATQTALVAQIKQITPDGSSVPTPGTIHITATDKTTDSYSVKEIGLFTSTGVLFAVYSQATDILVKGSGSVALFAIDFVITGVPPGSVTIGDASFQYPPATETVKGVAEIATTAEVTAGEDDERIVTPAKLKSKLTSYALVESDGSIKSKTTAKAWVNFLSVGGLTQIYSPPGQGTTSQGDSAVRGYQTFTNPFGVSATVRLVGSVDDYLLVNGSRVGWHSVDYSLGSVAVGGSFTLAVENTPVGDGSTNYWGASISVIWTPSNLGSIAIKAAHNVSSITYHSTGQFTVNFTTPFFDENYAFFGCARQTNDTTDLAVVSPASSDAKTVSAFRFQVKEGPSTFINPAEVCLAFFN